MGVNHIETDLQVHTIRPVADILRSSARCGVTAEKNAHKLRAEGLSYRRIAVELRVRYDQVSRWLSGSALPADAARPRPTSPEPPVAATAQTADRTAAEAASTGRINDLMATLRQVSRESREREERLHRVIEVERAAAREQMARRDAELDALRATVNELAARIARMDVQEPHSWRQVWRRGAPR